MTVDGTYTRNESAKDAAIRELNSSLNIDASIDDLEEIIEYDEQRSLTFYRNIGGTDTVTRYRYAITEPLEKYESVIDGVSSIFSWAPGTLVTLVIDGYIDRMKDTVIQDALSKGFIITRILHPDSSFPEHTPLGEGVTYISLSDIYLDEIVLDISEVAREAGDLSGFPKLKDLVKEGEEANVQMSGFDRITDSKFTWQYLLVHDESFDNPFPDSFVSQIVISIGSASVIVLNTNKGDEFEKAYDLHYSNLASSGEVCTSCGSSMNTESDFTHGCGGDICYMCS